MPSDFRSVYIVFAANLCVSSARPRFPVPCPSSPSTPAASGLSAYTRRLRADVRIDDHQAGHVIGRVDHLADRRTCKPGATALPGWDVPTVYPGGCVGVSATAAQTQRLPRRPLGLEVMTFIDQAGFLRLAADVLCHGGPGIGIDRRAADGLDRAVDKQLVVSGMSSPVPHVWRPCLRRPWRPPRHPQH